MANIDKSMWCGAINCSNSKKKCPMLSFHRFPEDPKRSKEWVVNTRRKDLDHCSAQYLSNNNRLCTLHFEFGMYYPGTNRLRKEAVPTVFSIPNPPPSVSIKRPLVLRQTTAPPTKKPAVDAAAVEEPAVPAAATEEEAAATAAAEESSFEDLIGILSDTEVSEDDEVGDGLEENLEDDSQETKEHRAEQISGRKQGSERRLNRVKSRLHRKKLRIAKLEKDLEAEKKVSSDSMDGLSKAARTIFSLQKRTASMAPKARRYTDEEMTLALALYFQGARAYRFLQKQFVLPSTRVLRKNMERIRLQPGFHDAVLSVLKERFHGASSADKMCVVSFDEMSVRSKLTYLRGADMVEGYQDFGDLGRAKSVATHALVFMVRGVTARWKQAVGYFLSCGPTKAKTLKDLLLECLQRLQEAGMTVVATVCDMGTTNQQAYRLLGVDKSGSFQCGEQRVTGLFDVPHLFKCIRNALLNYAISVDGKVAKWSHLVQLHNADRDRQLRAVPKLKTIHLRPTAFKKMTVRFATQALSRSVAAGLSLYADFGILPAECRDTAAVVLQLNDLLDVLNSRGRLDQCLCKRAISRSKPTTEEHHTKVLQDADEWLGRWVVGTGSVRIDSIAGLQQTIRGVQVIWGVCKEMGCNVLCTRRLNQDGLENLFGVIRQRGGDREHPNPTQFRHAYKHALVNNLMSAPDTANCEADGDSLIAALREMVPRAKPPNPLENVTITASECVPPVLIDAIAENCIGYVAGYLLHKECKCAECRAVLAKDSNVAVMASETLAALKSHTSLTSMDVGSLKLPTPEFLAFVSECYKVFRQHAHAMTLDTSICRRLVCHMLSQKASQALRQKLCHPRLLFTIASTYTRLMLHPLCERLTWERAVGGPARKSRKLLKLKHL